MNRAKRSAPRLRQLMTEHGGSTRAFAKKVGVSEGLVRSWLNGGTPGGESLRAISDATGVSIDWLLGFGVPRYRQQREKIGALSSELYTTLWREQPHTMLPAEAMPSNTPAIVAELASVWWAARFDEVRRTWSDRLRAFHDFLDAEAADFRSEVADGSPIENELDSGQGWLRNLLERIDSPYCEWHKIAALAEAMPLVAFPGRREGVPAVLTMLPAAAERTVAETYGHSSTTAQPRQLLVETHLLETPWPVLGGFANVGVAIRWKDRDYAWFLDRKSRRPRRKISRGSGHLFLVPAKERNVVWKPVSSVAPGERSLQPVHVEFPARPRGVSRIEAAMR